MQKMVFAFAMTALTLCLSACAGKNSIQKEGQTSAVPDLPAISQNAQEQASGQSLKGQWVEVRESQDRVIAPDIYQYTSETSTPEVVRYDRYLLVGTSPQEGQKYLLEQLIDVKVPTGKGKKPVFNATIRQGLETILANTGFTLCRISPPEVSTLFSLPLPKIHYSFGSMKLREALQMIAGPAYDLTVNDISRTICFKPRPVSERIVVPTTEVTTTTTEVIETDAE